MLVSNYSVSYAEEDRKAQFHNWYWKHAQLLTPSYNLTNLKRCSYYRFQIQAITSQGLKGKSTSESFRTSGCFATLPLAQSTSSSSQDALACKTSSPRQNIMALLLLIYILRRDGNAIKL